MNQSINHAAPIISAKGIHKSYREQLDSKPAKTTSGESSDVVILRDLNLEVQAGETLAIVGASGSGKSTLLHILGGLDQADRGEVRWLGHTVDANQSNAIARLRNQTLGFIYQFHHLLPEFNALDNVALPLKIRGETWSMAREQARLLLKHVGLDHRLHHRPAQLSGGERQRVAVARALVTRPKAILADEPTGNLDSQTAARVFDLLLTLNAEQGTALILVTHAEQLAQRCQRVYRLDQATLLSP